jgi:hypothetical protein
MTITSVLALLITLHVQNLLKLPKLQQILLMPNVLRLHDLMLFIMMVQKSGILHNPEHHKKSPISGAFFLSVLHLSKLHNGSLYEVIRPR